MVLTESLIRRLDFDPAVALGQCPSVRGNSFYPRKIKRISCFNSMVSKMEEVKRSGILWTFIFLSQNWPENFFSKERTNLVIGHYLNPTDRQKYLIYVYYDSGQNIYICDDHYNENLKKIVLLLPPRPKYYKKL
jgi:hypothetical protein